MSTEAKYVLKFQSKGVMLELDDACFQDKAKYLHLIKEDLTRKKLDQVDMTVVEKAFGTDNPGPMIIAPPQPEPVDGKVHSKLTGDDSRVEIKIEPPMGRGRKAELKDVMASIKAAGAGDFFLDLEKIENMLTSFRFRDFVPVGERRNGRFDIIISKDMTEATINLAPPFGGLPIDMEDVFSYLKNEGITFGIKKDTIKKVIEEEVYNQNVVIAVGEKAADGSDASLEFFFDHTFKRAKPQMNEDGEIDFRELNLIQTVNKGDPLVRKISANPGIFGKTIMGTEVKPRQGRDIPFPSGINCTVDPKDPELVVAAASGQPRWSNNKVSVAALLEVPGDVDFSTGNINFTGSVNIRGNVISGFSVKAMGDVQIGGTVEMCTIECGGNLSIRQGIVGQEKSLIICRGNLSAKFADKATIYCEGNIYIDEALLFCTASSSGEVIVSGKKGYIMGGITRATKSVTANRIGTPTQTPTVIEVGGSPSLRQELEDMENMIQNTEEKADNFARSLQTAEKMKDLKGGELSEEQKQRVLHMSRDRFALMSKLRAFKEKKEELEDKLNRMRGSSLKVNIKDKGLPGTKITIKTATLVLYDEVNFTAFYENDGEIQMMPFGS